MIGEQKVVQDVELINDALFFTNALKFQWDFDTFPTLHYNQGFSQGVLGTRFGSLESAKIIIGPLESEKSGPCRSTPGT